MLKIFAKIPMQLNEYLHKKTYLLQKRFLFVFSFLLFDKFNYFVLRTGKLLVAKVNPENFTNNVKRHVPA